MSSAPPSPLSFDYFQSRELEPDEFEKLKELWPFKDAGVTPSPNSMKFIVVEKDGEIIGYWGLISVIHAEPLWIHPEHRKNIGVGRALWRGVVGILRKLGVPSVFALVEPGEGASEKGDMANRLGFTPIGTLYAGRIPPLNDGEKGGN